jgi:hypothetical protein
METNKYYEDNNIRTNSDDLTYSEEENLNKRKANINKNEINNISKNMEEMSNKKFDPNRSKKIKINK